MKRSPWLLGLVACVLLTSLAARAEAPRKPRVTLTWWCSHHPTETGWAIMMTRQWNRSHPDVQVRLQSLPQERVAEDVLRDAIRDGKTPDLCTHLFPANVHEFVGMHGLLPLDAFPSLMAAASRRSGSAMVDTFRSFDGKLYQVPWKCNPIMMQYNKGLLKKHGLKPPRTYSEFLAVAEALRTKAHVLAWAPNPTVKWWNRYYDWYPLYLAASGGKPLLDAKGHPAFNTPAAVAVLDFLARCYKKGYAPTQEIYKDQTALGEAFAAGKVAFMLTGSWSIQATQELAGKTVQFDFCPLPVPDGTHPPVYTYGNFRNIGIFATSRHAGEAARFVEYLISHPTDVAFVKQCSELPCRPGLLQDASLGAAIKKTPYLEVFARQLSHVRTVGNAPHFNRVLEAISKQFVEAAVLGTKSSQKAIEDAAGEASHMSRRPSPQGVGVSVAHGAGATGCTPSCLRRIGP